MTEPENDADITAQSSLMNNSKDVCSVADLLLRIRGGDTAAWDEIIRRYGKLVTATIRSFQLKEADAFKAAKMTWWRLAQNAHRILFPKQLGEWLATTARHECLHILRQTKLATDLIDAMAETPAYPLQGIDQHAIDADTAPTPRKLVDELPPDRTLLRTLFPDTTYSYAEIPDAAEIPAGGIGATRARALRQLLRKPDTQGVSNPITDPVRVKGRKTENDRTGSYFLDDLLDRAEQALLEKLEPKVTDLRISSTQGVGDAQLDELLHEADAALRAALNNHKNSELRPISTEPHALDERLASQPAVSSDDFPGPASARVFLLGDDIDTVEALSRSFNECGVAQSALEGLCSLSDSALQAVNHEIATVADGLLNLDLGDLLVSGWRKHTKLTRAAERTLASSASEELAVLATHRVVSTHHPSVELFIDGVKVHTFALELRVVFDLNGVTAVLRRGHLVTLRAGQCVVTVTLTLKETSLELSHSSRINLPLVLKLPRPIPLTRQGGYTPAFAVFLDEVYDRHVALSVATANRTLGSWRKRGLFTPQFALALGDSRTLTGT